MYSLTFSIAGFILTGILVYYSFSAQRNVDFVMSAAVAASFVYCHVIPYFANAMKIFEVITTVLLLTGAVVGGVVGLLLPRITTGLILGFLIGLFIDAATYGVIQYGSSGSIISLVIYLTSLLVFIILSIKKECQQICSMLRTAITTGLAFTLSVDFLLQGSLLTWVARVVRLNEYDENLCFFECQIPWLLATWGLSTAIFFLYHASQAGHLKHWLNSMYNRQTDYSYNPIRQQVNAPTDAKRHKQRTFTYPDTLEYNFFDPDNIPPEVNTYSDIVFPIVQKLAAQYGFQVDSSRNQAEHLLMILTNEINRLDYGNLIKPVYRTHYKLFRNYRLWCQHVGTMPLFNAQSATGNYENEYDYPQDNTDNDNLKIEKILADISLWLLIWGEAGNMKHMPESLCFLYHKTMCDQIYFTTLYEGREIYPGFYLDMVVTPIYEVIAAGLSKKGDHMEKKTYDDFNEFFWTPTCLKYHIIDHHILSQDDVEYNGQTNAKPLMTLYTNVGKNNYFKNNGNGTSYNAGMPLDEAKLVHVSVGLQDAAKTYVEKRSWFHPLLNLHRIFEWHSVTFTILATIAFSNQLVWNLSYTMKIMSFVFWEISLLNICWASLEVWLLIPHADVSGPSKCGYLIRLLAGYILLVYQTIYYHWAFPVNENVTVNSLQAKGDSNFWWWQYVWISLIALSIYILESFMCWYPFIVSNLLTYNDDLLQALLNICYPLSQIFVGKKVHVPQGNVYKYIIYWVTLIGFKFWFSYYYIVFPVTVPSLELYDDYVNFQHISFFKTCLLFFIWWFPHFLVYLIDLSIWYSLWSSILGGFIALVDRQGAVRDSKSFRSHFMKSPIAFCQKLMPSSLRVSTIARDIPASTASFTNISVAPTKATTSNTTTTAKSSLSGNAATLVSTVNGTSELVSTNVTSIVHKNNNSRIKSTADLSSLNEDILSSYQQSSTTSLNDVNNGYNRNTDNTYQDKFMNTLATDVGSRWTVFATVWNEVIEHLRRTDHINNTERDNHIFSTFTWLSKPVYLPLFQTAGCIENAMYSFKEASIEFSQENDPIKKMKIIENFQFLTMELSMKEAVNEAWELSGWLLLKFLGPMHKDDLQKVIDALDTWADSSTCDLFSRFNAEALNGIVTHMVNITNTLKPMIAKRKKNIIVTREVLEKNIQATIDADASKIDETKSKVSSTGGIKKSVSTGFLSSLAHNNSSATVDKSDRKALTSSTDSKQRSGSIAAVGSSTQNNNNSSRRFTKLQPFRKGFLLTDTVRDRVREDIKNLMNAIRTLLRVPTMSTQSKDLIDRITFILSLESGFLWNDLYASKQLDELSQDHRSQHVLNKLNGLLRLRQSQVDTLAKEPKRRLNFFINSLFMEMPLVPQTRYVKDFSTLTPFYAEDVLLSKDDLESKNSDGVSTLLYLQTLYKKDWHNFLERFNLSDDQSAFHRDNIQHTRMWASLRAQTLFRTVDGMMYNEAALRLISSLEQLSSNEIEVYAKLKYNYVVACQAYGQMKKNLESKAEDIEFLLQRHPNLRVAYIDAIRPSRDGDMTYYSVLIKYDPTCITPTNKNGIKEVYRIKLAGNPVLGEGKPENQNHAIIFTRGRYLQAIDMNQDGYFEEALKMRNMLQEFDSGCAILGFREHIFTGSVSSVANYMALQELSFVTLGQRVLATPLCIRQHYGHPDLFDKYFTMTEGGMSKASKGINLSEDVFAGFNATIRGHTVGFKEYAQVGKGRDVGLQQTYKFEAKLAQGNAEQSLSRDLSRICDRLDFFRLMSFYYGGIGHYIANTMVMFTLIVVVYSMVGLALFNEEGVNNRPMHPEGVLQLLLAGLGLLQTMPLVVTLTVEKGIWNAITEISYMFMSGGPLYFIFHIQTKCYYFSQTLMTGGAAYRPTGRGFVIRHSSFDENYRFFATSHIYLGFELMVALIIFAMHTKSKQYGGLTWSLWLTAVSFLLGPYWFNPVTFEWNKLVEDYYQWLKWMSETGGSSDLSWAVWWREENTFYKNLSISWKCFIFVQKCIIWLVIGFGLFQERFFRDRNEQQRLLTLFSLFIIYIIGHWSINKLERSLSYAARRFISLTLSTSIGILIIYFIISHTLYLRYLAASYFVISSISAFCLLLGFPQISYVYQIHDYIVGHTIFFILGVLSTLQIGYLQTWLLYHNALSAGVVIEDILKHARKTKERSTVDEEDMSVLRQQLIEQERIVKQLYETIQSKDYVHVPKVVDEKTSLLSKTTSHSGGGATSSISRNIIPSFTGGAHSSYGSTTNTGNTASSTNSTDIHNSIISPRDATVTGTPKKNIFEADYVVSKVPVSSTQPTQSYISSTIPVQVRNISSDYKTTTTGLLGVNSGAHLSIIPEGLNESAMSPPAAGGLTTTNNNNSSNNSQSASLIYGQEVPISPATPVTTTNTTTTTSSNNNTTNSTKNGTFPINTAATIDNAFVFSQPNTFPNTK